MVIRPGKRRRYGTKVGARRGVGGKIVGNWGSVGIIGVKVREMGGGGKVLVGRGVRRKVAVAA